MKGSVMNFIVGMTAFLIMALLIGTIECVKGSVAYKECERQCLDHELPLYKLDYTYLVTEKNETIWTNVTCICGARKGIFGGSPDRLVNLKWDEKEILD